MTREARDRYGSPAKLTACVARGPGSGAELFLVEGDSAAAAVAGVRDPATQAVLPMQGKPLNAARASRDRVLAHPFFGPLVAALGVGVETACDAGPLRYDRVLVLTDPDADGIHCGFLVLRFFHRWLAPLLDAGRVEVVRPPWGEVVVDGRPTLAFSEPELAGLVESGRDRGAITVRRFRGLAALDAAMLRDTCVAVGSRRTTVVSAADVAAMIELVDHL
jgi:DNA gyrase subunit B/topoisomerase-4 subunit B